MTPHWWQLDWLWQTTGWVIFATGIALLLWSLFHDRSRPPHHRRCPKCWYNMTGAASLTCPECGHDARDERHLLKTRRHWRRACAAMLALVFADLAWSVPRSWRTGWAAFLPGPVLLAFVPADPPPPAPPNAAGSAATAPERWWDEVHVRYGDGAGTGVLRPMRGPSRWLLAWGAARSLRTSTSDRARYDAAFILAQVDPRAPERVDASTRGTVIAACSDAAYATCTSYEDVALHKGNIGGRDEKVSFTSFERPDRLRFEYLAMHPSQTRFSMRGVIWQTGAPTKMWWTIQPQVQTSPDPSMPIASFTGVSSSLAHAVPMRLLRSGRGRIGATTVLDDDACDGRACYHIRSSIARWTEDFWIDKQTFGILRIERPGPFFDITVYRPRFNAECSPGAFEFDPAHPDKTPLGDGESTCAQLRPLLGPRRTGDGK